MAIKIMWVSRHQPTKRQLTTLQAIYPNHELIINPDPFNGADDIASRFIDAKADELVAVAPWHVIRELVRRGIKPLFAEMRSASKADAEVELPGRRGPRYYRFVRFHRVNDVTLDLADPVTGEVTRELPVSQ